jgi:hypothetical protein
LVDRGHGPSGRLRDAEAVEKLLEAMAVLRQVDRLHPAPDDASPTPLQSLGQIYGGLPAKLYDRRRLLQPLTLQHVAHALFVKRLEIQAIGCIEVSAHRLRVAVQHDALHARLM